MRERRSGVNGGSRRRVAGLGRARGPVAAVGGLVCACAMPASAVDFFWSATADVFGWFDRETPNGPPGFSPWQLFGGGISGEHPDDVSDRAIFGLDKTTTLNTSVMIDSAVMNGGELLMQGGTLTTITGFANTAGTLSFTSGTVNNSAAQLTNGGTVRIISGSGTISSNVANSGTFSVGGGGTMNLNRAGATFNQTAGAFDVLAGGTANFTGSGHTLNFDGGTITNDGTVNLGSSAVLDLDGAAINNRGIFNIGSNSTIDLRSGSIDNTGANTEFNINPGGVFNHHGGTITGNAIEMEGGALNLLVPLATPGGSVGNPAFQFNQSGALTGSIHANIDLFIGDATGATTVSTTGSFENRGEVRLTGATTATTALGLQSGATMTNVGTLRAAFAAGGNQARRISGGQGTVNNVGSGDLIVDPGATLTFDGDLTNTGTVMVGTGGELLFGSSDDFDMNGGTLNNQGRLFFNGTSGESVFRYAGGTLTGNPIEFSGGQLDLAGGNSPATFHFIGGTFNELRGGDIGSSQTVVLDAQTGNTSLRRGTVFSGDFSFSNHGTLRITGAASNGSPTFSLNGNQSVLTNTGEIHAVGVPGSTNQRTIGASSGARITNFGQINVDPDTTLTLNPAVVNNGDVNIGVNGTINSTTGSSDFTHDAGNINNQGAFLLSGDDFTFNGGTITGNAIDITGAALTLGPTTGPASFILRGGHLAGNVRPGQTIELRNDAVVSLVSDTPGDLSNNGTIILGGDGTGLHVFRMGPLFANLNLTNFGTFRTRNDHALGDGGVRQVNGEIDNRNLVVVEPNSEYRALRTTNRANFTVQAGGSVSGLSGGTFTQQAGTLTINGTIDIGGARFNYDGGNITGNPIHLDGGALNFGSGVTGGGTFMLEGGGGLGGEVSPNATVHLIAGNTGTASWGLPSGGDPLINRGEIVLDNSAGGRPQYIGSGTTTNETTGEIRGIGALSFISSIGTVINRGTLAPGNENAVDTSGLIEVFGLFTQENTGRLDFGLGGTAPTEHDRLTTNRTATLDGTLRLSLINGYTPALGDTLDVLSASSVVGTFNNIFQPIGMPGGLTFDVNYLSNSVQLEVVAAAFIPGDYNGSGGVEQGDLDLVLLNWGRDTSTQGVPNGWVNQVPTGLIAQTQLDGVLLNWGNTQSPDFSGSPVPEPGVLGLAYLSLAWRGRRHVNIAARASA